MRVAKRAPEVMVKVTGSNRVSEALNAHMSYLARESAEAQIEDENRATFVGNRAEIAADLKRVTREWGVAVGETDDEVGRSGRKLPVSALHIVLSMPKGTNPQSVLDAARGFAYEELSNHRYILALHQDKGHPHVHVVVNNVGYDLKPLSRNRDDLARWRETFAKELRKRGIEAEALPRKMRGVIQKPYNRKVMYAAKRSKEKHGDFRDARVYQANVRDAANAARGYGPKEPHPAEVRARQNRELAERVMKDAIDKLREQGEAGSVAAATVTKFLETMPLAETEIQAIQRELAQAGVRRETVGGQAREPVAVGLGGEMPEAPRDKACQAAMPSARAPRLA